MDLKETRDRREEIPYFCVSFPVKEPYDYWIFGGKRQGTEERRQGGPILSGRAIQGVLFCVQFRALFRAFCSVFNSGHSLQGILFCLNSGHCLLCGLSKRHRMPSFDVSFSAKEPYN